VIAPAKPSNTRQGTLDNPTGPLLDEGQNRLNFGRDFQLLPDSSHRLADVVARAIEELIGFLDLRPDLRRKPAATQAHHIQATIPEGFPGCHNIRRDIPHDTVTTAYNSMGAHAAELMDGRITPDESIVVNLGKAPQLHAVSQDYMVPNPPVMPHMNIGH